MEARPAPFAKEIPPKPERLLSEATTGGQALLLLGLEPSKPGAPAVVLQKEQLLRSATEGIPADHKKRLTTASLNEREKFWKNTPEAQRMETWRNGMNGFLDRYTKDQTKTAEQAFLKHILKRDTLDTITADTLYSTFMQGDGKGDIEFFARRIAETNSIEEIEKNRELIASLGKIYGASSAKIGELLAYGIANARRNPEQFVTSAQENLNKAAYGEDVWTPLAQNASQWDEKQQAKGPQKMLPSQPVNQTSQSPQPEQQKPSEEYHSLVASAGAASEASAGKKANQDAYFRDPKHGAFGVFDGLGSYRKSGEVANGAATHIAQALGQIDPQLPVDEMEKRVRKALTDASEELRKQEDARYREVVEDIKKNAAGALSNEDFDEKYEGPKRQRSISQWIRRHFDPAKPAEINGHLNEWINQQVAGSTTASVVKLWQRPQGESKAIIANVGDSRVYHYSARDGKLRIVTVDDNLLYDAVGEAKAREIQDAKASGKRKRDVLGTEKILLKQSNPRQRTVWEQAGDDFRSKYPWDAKGEVEIPLTEFDDFGMTKVVPMTNLEPSISTVNIAPHDKLIITSDGVHDELLISDMENMLKNPDHQEAAKATDALVKFAKKGELIPGPGGRPGKLKDDTTAVVIEIK